MFGLPIKAEGRYQPRLLATRTVSGLSSDATIPTIIEVPSVGALEITGDPGGLDFYVGGAIGSGGAGPFLAHRGAMIPAPPSGHLGLVQTAGSGTVRIYHWPPEIASIRLASAVGAALSGGSLSVTADTELPAAAALADNTANPTVPGVGAYLMGFDGTTWDRLGSALVSASVIEPSIVGSAQVTSALKYRWSNTNADWRYETTIIPVDAQGNSVEAGINIGLLEAFNGTTWDRVRTTGATTGALMPGYKHVNDGDDAVDTSTTGVKLTYTCPAAKDSEVLSVTCSTPPAGVTMRLEHVVGGGATSLILGDFTAATAAASGESASVILPIHVSCEAGDLVRWRVSVAAAGSVDLGISAKELR